MRIISILLLFLIFFSILISCYTKKNFSDREKNVESQKIQEKTNLRESLPIFAEPIPKIELEHKKMDEMKEEERIEISANYNSRIASMEKAVALPQSDADTQGGSGMISPQKSPEKPQKSVTTWKLSEIAPNTSKLMIGDKEDLPLQGIQVSVHLDGIFARVLLDCYFYNDRDRQFEGTFKLRLPNDASPYFFAFGESVFKAQEGTSDQPIFYNEEQSRKMGINPEEIMSDRMNTWTHPKEARMVPKEKAALAYTETVRRQIDPALMEWSGAGIFSARVFPLAPKRLHRIVIGYDVPLLQVQDDLEYSLILPAGVPKRIVDFNIAAMEGIQLEPQAKISQMNDRIYCRYENPEGNTLKVRIKKPGTILITGKDEKTVSYFSTTFRPDLPDEKEMATSSHAIFMVDVSLSSNPERFNVWLKLVESILKNNRDSLTHFAVLFFNIESFWWQEGFVENNEKNTQALLSDANRLVLEGSTDLYSAFLKVASPLWYKENSLPRWDVFLLSDGSATWGENDLYAMTKALNKNRIAALFAYTTGFAGTDTNLLRNLTRECAGAVFSVVGEAEVTSASMAHRSRPWQIMEIQIPQTSDLLLLGRPSSVFSGQTLSLVGRGEPKPGSKITMRLKRFDKEILSSIPLDHVLSSEIALRAYGQVAVGQMEDFQQATEEFSKPYATHFRITGQTCSLLMLETEEDYQRFNIKPEDDATVIKNKLASEIIANVLEKIGQNLGDPKASFLSWLEKMKQMQGVNLNLPKELQKAVESLPTSAFSVQVPSLNCKLRTWDKIPGSLQEELISKNLDYDNITNEAQRRYKEFGSDDALKALSSLVENNPGDMLLSRDVAFSAMEWNLGGHAYHLLRRIFLSRPYEPQTYLITARCLKELGKIDMAACYYEIGLFGTWDSRFGEFRRIVGMEYLRFLKEIHSSRQYTTQIPEYLGNRLESIAQEFDIQKADLLVIITWNTDNSDVDLHVIEPDGEECFYNHNQTKNGGCLTQDVTQGYGPEMYLIQKAAPGQYKISVKYFSSERNRASARTKVYATIITAWGQKEEKILNKVVTLHEGKEMHDVGTIIVKD